MNAYYAPPGGYEAPVIDGCATCGEIILCEPVIGGYGWKHLTRADHAVVMPRPWWDTKTGEWYTEPIVWTSRDSE
ncbi:hypothetical protein [Parafrankia sp. FMc2]|uniref:hypothetical protein n=1 Tax=Parafrankia sp. FMc2 TaxID=3233196 RepID=UPI0034D56C2B